MKILLILSICFLAVSAGHRVSRSSGQALEKALYDAVTAGKYSEAVNQAVHLRTIQYSNLIQYAIARLINEGNTKVFDFGYKLWVSGHQEIVEDDFPVIFKKILAQNLVIISSVDGGYALKLGSSVHDGERVVYGDKSDSNSENIAWKIVPSWDDNKVYFKLFGINHRQYLKLGKHANPDNEHPVLGEDHADTRRHEWYLKPVNHNDKLEFFIYNRQFNQVLALATESNDDEDKRIRSYPGQAEEKPDLFAWVITSFY